MHKRTIGLVVITLVGCSGIILGLYQRAQHTKQSQQQSQWDAHYQQTVQIAQPAIAAANAAHDRVKRKADAMRAKVRLGLISRQEAAHQVQVEGDAALRELNRVQATNYRSPYNVTAQ